MLAIFSFFISATIFLKFLLLSFMEEDIKMAEVGAEVKTNSFVDGDHNMDFNINSIEMMMLKSEFVKKA